MTTIGAPLLAAWPIAPASAAGRALRIAEPVEDPLGEERLGRDHVGHVERRARRGPTACGSSSHGSGAAASGARGSNVVIDASMADRKARATHGSADRRDDRRGRRRARMEVTNAGRVDGAAGLEGRVRRLGSGRGLGRGRSSWPRRPRSSGSSRSGSSTTSTPSPSRPTRSRSSRSASCRRSRSVDPPRPARPHGRLHRRSATRPTRRSCRRRST